MNGALQLSADHVPDKRSLGEQTEEGNKPNEICAPVQFPGIDVPRQSLAELDGDPLIAIRDFIAARSLPGWDAIKQCCTPPS